MICLPDMNVAVVIKYTDVCSAGIIGVVMGHCRVQRRPQRWAENRFPLLYVWGAWLIFRWTPVATFFCTESLLFSTGFSTLEKILIDTPELNWILGATLQFLFSFYHRAFWKTLDELSVVLFCQQIFNSQINISHPFIYLCRWIFSSTWSPFQG